MKKTPTTGARALACLLALLPLTGCPSEKDREKIADSLGAVGSHVKHAAQEIAADVARASTINGSGPGSKTQPLYAEAARLAPWQGYGEDGAPSAERVLAYERIREAVRPVYVKHAALLDTLEGSTAQRRDWDALLDAWAEVKLAFAQSLVDQKMSEAEARYLTVCVDDQWCAEAHTGHEQPSVRLRESPLNEATRARVRERAATLEPLEHPKLDRLLFRLGLATRRVLLVLVPQHEGFLAGMASSFDDMSDSIRYEKEIRGEAGSESARLLAEAQTGAADEASEAAFKAVRAKERAFVAEQAQVFELAEQGLFVYDGDRLLLLQAWADLKILHARALGEHGLSDARYRELAKGESGLLDRLLFELAPIGLRVESKGRDAPYPVPQSGGWDD